MMRFRFLIAFALLFTTLLPSVASGQAAYTPPTAAQIADLSNCLLTQVAFCDTFNEGPATGSVRSGALDESKWSVSHVTGMTNLGQGQANEFFPSDYMHCMDPKTGLLPPNDYFMCAATPPGATTPESMHFMEAFNDHGNYDYNSAMIRQPFDFANRTGTVSFDVDAKTDGGHMWWPEIWITDQPIPGPHFNTSPSLPRNGIGIELLDNGPSGTPTSSDATGTGLGNVGTVDVINNYVDTFRDPGRGVNLNGFYKTAPDQRNRFQVRISQNDVQVWATDYDGTNFREVADVPGINLNFTRGYVAVQHADYNPEKYGITGQQTYHWDNIGFDGPVLPLDRGYSVPDALTPGHDAGSLNLAYVVSPQGLGTCCTTPHAPFTLTGVNLAGAVAADLTLDVWDTATKADTFSYAFNGAAVTAIPFPPPNIKWGTPVPLVIPVPLSALQNGSDTLTFSASEPFTIANIDLTLRMSSLADSGTVATSSSTANTSTSTATITTSETTTSPASATTSTSTTATVTVSTFTLVCTEQNGDVHTITCKAA